MTICKSINQAGFYAKRKPLIAALEARVLLDGAAVATAADAIITDVDLQNANDNSQVEVTSVAPTRPEAPAPVHYRAADPEANNGRKEVVFIDTSLDDYQTLIDGTHDGIEIQLFGGEYDGLTQIALWAEAAQDYDAIHILSHGDVGELTLGSQTVNSDSLDSLSETLVDIGQSLNESGDILLYGCNVGANNEGLDFIQSFADLTQADIAASNDLTGSESLGGDWVLEVSRGGIDVNALNVSTYDGALLDTDGDGIDDATDIDDDNDGLLDINESQENFQWASGITPSGNTATGSIAGVGFTYTLTTDGDLANPINIKAANDVGSGYMYNHGLFPAEYNVPDTAGTAVQNDDISHNKITFAQTTLNPTLAFASIGSPTISVGIKFSQDVEVIFENNTDKTQGDIVSAGTEIFGTEGHLIVKYNGEYDEIVFEYTAAESWVNFTFGADIRQDVDTDGDGTVDRLDTDSDNDGVLDNVEAQVSGGFGVADPTTLTGYTALSGNDADSDGLDDAYDSDTNDSSSTVSQGLTAVDTNANGTLDYLVDEAPVLTVGSLNTHDGSTTSTVVVAPNLTLLDVENQNLDGAKIQINNNQVGDTLSFTNDGSTMGSITSSYDAASGVLSLSGTASAAEYQSAMSSVEFSSTSGNTVDRSMSFTVGSAIPYSGNGHYYQAVALPSDKQTWTAAKDYAETLSLYGMQGYLATITTQAENDFILSKLPEDGWAGGSDSETEGTWKWISGPEAGTIFSTGNDNPVTQTYANWNSGEPNDSGSNEDALQFYASGSTPGQWNDLSSASTLSYAIVEFGGMPGDPTPVISGTSTMVVNDIPVITASDTQSYTENASPVKLAPSISVSDDGSTFSSATITITSNFDATHDQLSFVNDGQLMGNIQGTYDSTNGVLTLTSAGQTATLAEWTAALRSVSFQSTDQALTDTSKTITWKVNDGDLDSSTVSTTLTTVGVSGDTYTEQAAPIILNTTSSFNSDDNFGTGFVRYEVTAGQQAEDILRLDSSTTPTTQDHVSVVGNTVYVGQGAGEALLKVGNIDSYYNGQDGRALQINFDNATIPGSSPVINGDFSSTFNSGWNAYTGTVNLGSTAFNFGGKSIVIPEPGSAYYPSQTPGRDDNDLSGSRYGTYDNGIVQISNGELRLEESGLTTTSYGVAHGPAAYSDNFYADAGMVLQFDWRANNISDDYHVVAYLMNVDTGVAELVFADYGTRGSGTEFVSVNTDGNYSFVFVSGTFDRTGGTAAGASMYIDNIKVEKAAVTGTALNNLALQVQYENTSDNPVTTKTVTLSTKDINGATTSEALSLNITPLNDPSALASDGQLLTILEDQTVNEGQTVAQLFGGVFSDVDNGDTLGGVFITNNPLAGDTSKGTWEYKTADANAIWRDIGTVSTTNALLLADDTNIRFNAATDYFGTPDSLTLRGVDQALDGLANTTTDDGTNSLRATYDTDNPVANSGLSATSRALSISVTSVNDIPIFTNVANASVLTETSSTDTSESDLTLAVGDVLTGSLAVDDVETDAASLDLIVRGGVETSTGVWQLTGRYGTLVLDTTNNNTWTYTPDNFDAINAIRQGQVVEDTFKFKVSDGDGGVATQDFTINFGGINDIPLVANLLTDQSFIGDGTWMWQVPANTFTDAEGTGLTYTSLVTHEAGVAVTPYEISANVNGSADGSATDWLTFDADSRTFTGDPTVSWSDKSLTVKIIATDQEGAQADTSFNLALTDTDLNQAPTVANEMNWTSIDAAAAAWTLQIPSNTFDDDDSSLGLSYSAFIINSDGTETAIGSAAGAIYFDSANGQLKGDGTVQDLLVKIVATDNLDGGYSQEDASTQFQLSIYDSSVSIPSVSLVAGSAVTGLLVNGEGNGSYTLPANAFDIEGPAGSTVTYAAQLSGGGALPSWLSFDTATGTFTGNPPDGTTNLNVEVAATVSDSVTTVSSNLLDVTLTVTTPNDPIVLMSTLDDKTVLANTQLGLTFSAPFADPDAKLSGFETNSGIPRVDGVDYAAFIVDESGNETPASSLGLTLDQNGTNLTLNGNPPGGYAYLNILIRGTEVDGGTSESTTFTVFLNDASASGVQDVAAYSANDVGVVNVTGTPTQGQTLTASTTDADGLTGVVTYQWQVSSDNGTTWVDIGRSDAQSASLLMTQAEAGKVVRVQSLYTDDRGVFESPVSTALAIADVEDIGVITVSGSPIVDGVLSATLTDADGLTTANPSYQWQVSTDGGTNWSNISGATYSTYTATENEGGHQVRVLSTYTDDMSNTSTVTSDATTIQLGALAPVAINDTASITEAGGVANSAPVTAPVTGNVLTNDTDQNSGDTKAIANLRTGIVEGFGNQAIYDGTGNTFTLSGSYGQIVMNELDGSYSYTLDETNATVEALAPGDSITENFNYSVEDSTSLFDVGLLSITINGSNDAPVISVVDEAVNELVDASAQAITINGVIRIEDVDTGDVLSAVSVNKNDISWSHGTLSTSLGSLLENGFSLNRTNLSAPDSIAWTYSAAAADLDFLGAGEHIAFSYDITLTDSGNLTDTKTLTFTINGTNDAPTIVDASYTEKVLGFGEEYSLDVSGWYDDLDINNQFTYQVNNLPRGMAFDANTGVIFGAPEEPGVFTIEVTGIDDQGDTVSRSFELTVTAPPEPAGPAETGPAKPADNGPNLDGGPEIKVDSGKLPDGLVESGDEKQGFAVDTQVSDTSTLDNSPLPDAEPAPLSEQQVQKPAAISVNVGADGQVSFDKAREETLKDSGLAVADIVKSESGIELFIFDSESAQSYTAVQQDGTALPSWISVEPSSGLVKANPPEGVESISVKLTATSPSGEVRILNIELRFEDDNEDEVGTENPVEVALPPQAAFSDQLNDEVAANYGYGSQLASALFADHV